MFSSEISSPNPSAVSQACHKLSLKACNPSTIKPEANIEQFPYSFNISLGSYTAVKGAWAKSLSPLLDSKEIPAKLFLFL